VGAASGGGSRQLGVWGGCTQWRGARGVVKTVGEMPEWAVHGGLVVAGTMAQWGKKQRRKRGCSTRVGALYSCQRRWMTAAWGNGGGGAVGMARWWRPLSEGGRRGPDTVGPWFGPGS
jgi:hypothetical protein